MNDDFNEVMKQSCWIIDIMPKRVPEAFYLQYQSTAAYFKDHSRFIDILRRFAQVLIKLNCYYEISVQIGFHDVEYLNPEPDFLTEQFLKGQRIQVLIHETKTLIDYDYDDLWMSVFSADQDTLELIRCISASEGFCFWKAS